ncbi:hypothetical protein BZG36_00137 [Bifiguratus adelaidae]|uniref:Uncharacterized protein n=1 Tax=Bifiguratus adelaidae TaxID=1938954 RepID=A0A261Y8P0_9FUNG|nr:hypothetical protein BZG36_00137 [Bifiguratus adelaidae]
MTDSFDWGDLNASMVARPQFREITSLTDDNSQVIGAIQALQQQVDDLKSRNDILSLENKKLGEDLENARRDEDADRLEEELGNLAIGSNPRESRGRSSLRSQPQRSSSANKSHSRSADNLHSYSPSGVRSSPLHDIIMPFLPEVPDQKRPLFIKNDPDANQEHFLRLVDSIEAHLEQEFHLLKSSHHDRLCAEYENTKDEGEQDARNKVMRAELRETVQTLQIKAKQISNLEDLRSLYLAQDVR